MKQPYVTEEAVVDYLAGNGYGQDKKMINYFLNHENPEQVLECVKNGYHLADWDRWQHLQAVLGETISYQTSVAVDELLWEDGIETLELAALNVKPKKGKRAHEAT